MRISRAENVEALLRKRHEKLLDDRKLPLSVRQMISAHLDKPWIPGFWSVAIRPTGEGSKSYLDFRIGSTEAPRSEARSDWYFPSKKWWLAHAKASHPPNGSGCDVSVHVDFLTREGATHEFDYATILMDGQLTILHEDDFEKECRWWVVALKETRGMMAMEDVRRLLDEALRAHTEYERQWWKNDRRGRWVVLEPGPGRLLTDSPRSFAFELSDTPG